MAECPKCGDKGELDYTEDNNLTCVVCGTIVEETDNLRSEVDLVTNEGGTRACGSLVSATSNGTRAATSLPRNQRGPRPSSFMSSNINDAVRRNIDTIASQIGLGKPVADQMHHLYMTLSVDKGERYCRSAELLGAAFVYIVLRQSGKAYTLLDVSSKLNINIFEVGRVFNKIVAANNKVLVLKEPDPGEFVMRACNSVMGKWDEKKRNDISSFAGKIIYALKESWVLTGRHCDAVAAAAIMIAGDSLSIPEKKKDRKAFQKEICGTLHVTENTVKLRIKEMKSKLTQQAQSTEGVPYAREATEKTIHKILPKILDSYLRLQEAKEIRQKQEKEKQASGFPDVVVSQGTPPQVGNASPTASSSPVDSPVLPPTPAILSFPPAQSTQSIPSNPLNVSSSTPITPLCSSQYLSPPSDSKSFPRSDAFAPVPASFKANQIAREKRAEKMYNAIQRIIATYNKDPVLFADLPYARALVESFRFAPPHPPSSPFSFSISPTIHGEYPIAPEYKKPSPGALKTSSTLSPPPNPPLPFNPSSHASSSFSALHSMKREKKVKAEVKGRRTKKLVAIVQPIQPSLDQEDLLIERLLMFGGNMDRILDGYFESESSKLNTPNHPDLNSENVGEYDIQDSEMNKYVRGDDEIFIMEQLDESTLSLFGKEADPTKETSKKSTKKSSSSSSKKRKQVLSPSSSPLSSSSSSSPSSSSSSSFSSPSPSKRTRTDLELTDNNPNANSNPPPNSNSESAEVTESYGFNSENYFDETDENDYY